VAVATKPKEKSYSFFTHLRTGGMAAESEHQTGNLAITTLMRGSYITFVCIKKINKSNYQAIQKTKLRSFQIKLNLRDM